MVSANASKKVPQGNVLTLNGYSVWSKLLTVEQLNDVAVKIKQKIDRHVEIHKPLYSESDLPALRESWERAEWCKVCREFSDTLLDTDLIERHPDFIVIGSEHLTEE